MTAQRDPETVAVLASFVQAACIALSRLDAASVPAVLPAALRTLTPLLSAASDATRRAAADALRATIRACITDDAVAAACIDSERGGAPTGLARAVVALAAVLQPGYHDAWKMALPVVGDMIRALGRKGGPLVKHLLLPLADLCRCALRLSNVIQHCNGVGVRLSAS